MRQSKLQSIGLILMNQTATSKYACKRCVTVLVPTKTRISCKFFLINKLCIAKILKGITFYSN